jgi:hypothetical protein
VPSNLLKMSSTLSIGTNSKYNVYNNKWEYIRIYLEFYCGIKEMSVQ